MDRVSAPRQVQVHLVSHQLDQLDHTGNTGGTGLDDDNDDITDDGPKGVVDIANVLNQAATATSTGSATAESGTTGLESSDETGAANNTIAEIVDDDVNKTYTEVVKQELEISAGSTEGIVGERRATKRTRDFEVFSKLVYRHGSREGHIHHFQLKPPHILGADY